MLRCCSTTGERVWERGARKPPSLYSRAIRRRGTRLLYGAGVPLSRLLYGQPGRPLADCYTVGRPLAKCYTGTPKCPFCGKVRKVHFLAKIGPSGARGSKPYVLLSFLSPPGDRNGPKWHFCAKIALLRHLAPFWPKISVTGVVNRDFCEKV